MTIKKLGSVILALCLLLGICSPASGEVVGDTSTTTGVDVVIVLDMTSSMYPTQSKSGNDPNGYRIDATSMLIGMMDMDGSRVAIVPFASAPGKPVDIIGFTDVSNSQSRLDLISKIYTDYPGKKLPDTNIGAALMKADQMLLDREDKTNRPMIVLMTDGQNDIAKTKENPSGLISVPHSLRWENEQIVDKGTESYNTEKADTVTYEAFLCAQKNGIPVYTVALGTEPDKTSTGRGISLIDISLGTGALECQKVNKAEAQNLPAFFAKVLANQIGSSVEYTATPTPVEGQDGTYEVKIPILNEKVLETNVILPVKNKKGGSFSGIDADSIELIDSTGARVNGNSEITMFRGFANSHFAMIKIREARNPGMWTMRFQSDSDPSSISFNILYKYNIKFGVEVLTPVGGTEFYKTDKLNVKGRFMEESGSSAEDSALYRDHTGEAGYEDWMTIRSNWKLYRASSEGRATGDVLKEGTLNANTVQNLFETQINLAEGERLPSGHYLLVVNASGAGLDRTVNIPLELKNHEPAAGEFSQTIHVNKTDVGEDATWTVEGTSGQLTKNAREIVTDKDDDDVQFDLRPADVESQSLVEMTVDQESGVISYKTVLESEKIKAGTARYELHYNDMDGGTGSIPVTLEIVSDIDVLRDKYDFEVKITDESGNETNTFLKNKPVKITARLKDKETGTYDTEGIIGRLKQKLTIADLKSGETVVADGVMTLNGDALEYTVESTGNKEAQWSVRLNVEPFEHSQIIEIPGSNSPEPRETETVTINCDGEKVPGFLSSVIGENTPDDDPARIVAIKGLFTDKDNDELSYDEPRFIIPATGEAADPAVIHADKAGEGEDAVYTIIVSGNTTGLFNFTAEGEMHLTARDGDGGTGDYVRKVTIVDLYNKMLTYIVIIIIALIALIILYLIIHQIRKPVFPKLNMTIREEPSLYESGSETLSPVKQYTNINKLGVDADMANKHGISMELLQNIIVKPIRSRMSVGVICKKPAPGHEVMLEDVRMKPKKAYTWKVGQELTIRSENGDGLVAVKLEDRPDTDETYEEFKGDEWSEIDESAASRGGRKHSRKAERKAPPVEEEPSTSGSSDDFDF